MLLEFKPNTVPGADCLWIELPSEPYCDLDWTKELIAATASEKKIVWYFRLGLERPFFPLEDEFRFNSLCLALQQFTKEVWPLFSEKTAGLCLYRGEIVEFAMYFQMLAHKLPDEVPIWLLFEVEPSLSSTDALRLISKDGFEHFKLALRGKNLPMDGHRWDDVSICPTPLEVTTGLVFPTVPNPRFEGLLGSEPIKIVFEAFLSDQWEGLDQLHVLTESLTPQGTRMLQGFSAAGGVVVYH